MLLDLSCPCETAECTLPSLSAPWCSLTLRNVGDRRISSAEVTVRLLDAFGLEVTRQLDREFSLSADPGECFLMRVALSASQITPSIQRAEPVIEKVWFDDGSVWRRAGGTQTEVEVALLPAGRALDELRSVAGPDAVCYPQWQETVWICVCGRPNPSARTRCARCARARDEALSAFSEESVRLTVSHRLEQERIRLRALRKSAAMTLERLGTETFRRSASRTVTLFALLLLLSCCLLAWYAPRAGVPALAYFAADRAYLSDDFAQAEALFGGLGDYRDAPDRALGARYAQGVSLLEGGMDSLLRAEALFESLGDWSDSALRRCEAVYRRASLLSSAQPGEARPLFESLGEYRDSADRARQCAYSIARALLASGKDDEAFDAFTALDGWGDSAAQASAIRLRQGRAALDAGEYDTAVSRLSECADEAAAPLLRRAWYLKGHQLYQAGEMQAAGEAFLNASGYLDADAQAKRCILGQAKQAMASGNYVAAMDLLAAIPGWEDADSLRRQAILLEAGSALDGKQYDRAAELLQLLPEDDAGAQALRREAVYRPAAAALADEDWLAAMEGFSSLGSYRDSADQLKKARYGHAGALQEAGDLSGAETIFASLGDYADAASRLTAVRYALAGEAMARSDWAEAARLYTLTSGWLDSAEGFKKARKGSADAALAADDIASARKIFRELEDAQGLLDCDWADAVRLEAAGETEKAAEAFAALGDYPGAADRASALWASLAGLSRKTGAYEQAASYYRLAGDEKSALEMLTAIEDQLYAGVSAQAEEALSRGEWAAAASLLESLDMSLLPERYQGLPALYEKAVLSAAEEALGTDPEAAWNWLSRAWLSPGAEALREKAGWQLMGPWSDGEHTIVFLPDGTGEIDGEQLAWSRKGYVIYDGYGREVLKLACQKDNWLALRDVRRGDTGLILIRVGFE